MRSHRRPVASSASATRSHVVHWPTTLLVALALGACFAPDSLSFAGGSPNEHVHRRSQHLVRPAAAAGTEGSLRKLEVVYFTIPALAEPARILCALGELDWKDDRFSFAEWAPRKAEAKWGQVPLLKVGGKQIANSKAIARYLAKLVKVEGKPMYPEDPLEAALVDDVVDFFSDVHAKMGKTMSLPKEEKGAARQAALGEGGEVSKMLAMLEANVDAFAVGDSMTLADIFVFWYLNFLNCGFWDGVTDRADLISKPYPKLTAISEKVKAVPKIKEYYTKIAANEPMYKCFAA
ncbi:unnamed protein product [Polarella glacialis]|uniref:Glutathione transferase n=1 Tax=Polarella glacialis TaxID=89957 RepID=A0A813KXL8_POLGL|nr:unnamed protein product [Polarella glacialis]CAE8710710.1 unnamed protein product [Polarella glacialis]CAE8730575.1 unnamed protein product [Polarella glacialis]